MPTNLKKPKTETKRRHRRGTVPGTHHLDRRVDQVLAAEPRPAWTPADDDLLSTHELSVWFGVSPECLERWRHMGIGPPFKQIGPRLIRYERGKCRQYLQSRGQAAMRGEGK
jgi:hypothetical protein